MNHDTHCNDREVLIKIQKAIDSSPELRSKKALIQNFINEINEIDDVMSEWHAYLAEQKERELKFIITEERLNKEETRKFVKNAFRDGYVKTSGTDVDKILPPISRFGRSNRDTIKLRVISKLTLFFERYYGLGDEPEEE